MSLQLTKAMHEVMGFLENNFLQQIKGVDVGIPYLSGTPGGGKTSMVEYFCKEKNWNCVNRHFSLLPIEEIGGIPQFKDITIHDVHNDKQITAKGTEWSIPELITDLWRHSNNEKELTIAFLDDFHICSPSHYNLCFELFKRDLRGHPLPPNVAFVLAGNPSAKASHKSMPSFLVNRICLLPVHTDLKYWRDMFAIPNQINPKVVSFVSHEKYLKHFHETEEVGRPWASPRSWTRLANGLDSLETKNEELNLSDLLYYASSYVGHEAAQQFADYYILFAELDMKNIFNKTLEIKIPKDFLKMYIYKSAAISEFFNIILKKNNDKNRVTAIEVMALILIDFSYSKNSELVIASMKEIITDLPLRMDHIYDQLVNKLRQLDSKVADKLNNDISTI